MFDLIWPNKKKLTALRGLGIYPYSQSVIRLSILLAMILFAYYGSLNFLNITNSLLEEQAGLINDQGLVVADYQKILLEYLVLPSSLIILLVLALVGLKGRFAFNFSKIKFKLSNLWRVSFKGKLLVNQLFAGLAYFLVTLIFCLIIISSLLSFSAEFSDLLMLQGDVIALKQFFAKIISILLIGGVLLIPIFYLSRWFLFKLEYRMTAEESVKDSDFSLEDMIAKID